MERQYLAVCEVAELLGCSEKFVYKHQKLIPGYVKIKGLIRFNRGELLDGLKTKSKRPQSADNKHGL